jgi:4-amino-4-deoxy-L-arabinose transferase-like glycosyltransferase
MSRGERFALLAIVALALALRGWLDSSSIDGRAFLRHDEQHYVDLAREILNGRLVGDYFINPPLFGWLVAGGSAVAGHLRVALGDEPSFAHFVARETMSPWVIVLVGRGLSIAASVAGVIAVARLGRRLFAAPVGLAAALLLALDGLAISRAPLCGNESLVTLLSLLAVDSVIGHDAQELSRARRLGAGLLLGLATATKYSAGIFGVAFAVALGRRVGPAVIGAVLGFVVGAPATLLHFGAFVGGFTTQAAFLHEGYRPEDAVAGTSGWLWYAQDFPDSHLGLALAAAVALGIAGSLFAALRRTGARHRVLLAASLPLWLFLGSGIFHRDRFLLPATPFLLLHAAWLLHGCVHVLLRASIDTRRAGAEPRLATAASAALVVTITALAAPAVVAQRADLAAMYGRPDDASGLFAELRAVLRPDERVFELTFQISDELLIDAEPWRELRVAEPPPELRAAVRDDLARRALLPGAEPLRARLATAGSLAELQRELAEAGATALVVVLPSSAFTVEGGLAQARRNPPFRDCPDWGDLVEWLGSLPRRVETASRHGTLVASVVDLPR